MFMNFESIESKSVKTEARKTAFEMLFDMLSEKFDADCITQTDSGTYAVALGEKDGNEVCVEFSITTKDFIDRQTPKRGLVQAFDRAAAGEKYAAAREKAEASKAAKKAASDKKKEKDEERRAKAAEKKNLIEEF